MSAGRPVYQAQSERGSGGPFAKRPRRHQRKLSPPKRAIARAGTLGQDNVGFCGKKRISPASRVLEEERLFRPGKLVHSFGPWSDQLALAAQAVVVSVKPVAVVAALDVVGRP